MISLTSQDYWELQFWQSGPSKGLHQCDGTQPERVCCPPGGWPWCWWQSGLCRAVLQVGGDIQQTIRLTRGCISGETPPCIKKLHHRLHLNYLIDFSLSSYQRPGRFTMFHRATSNSSLQIERISTFTRLTWCLSECSGLVRLVPTDCNSLCQVWSGAPGHLSAVCRGQQSLLTGVQSGLDQAGQCWQIWWTNRKYLLQQRNSFQIIATKIILYF